MILKSGSQTFNTEIAKTLEERKTGLMHRASMPKDQGMLFIFERSGFHPFWMKNTLIPLDIIWINKDKIIVDIQTVPPCTTKPDCPNYVPKDMNLYVLEVNAGVFEGKVGERVEF